MNQPKPEYAIVVPIEEVKPRAASLKWWILAPLSILLLPVALYGITKIPIVEQYRLSKKGNSIAIYDGFEFVGSDRFRAYPQKLTAPIYVQLPNGNRYLLNELPEEEACKFLPLSATDSPRARVYTEGDSYIRYIDGDLHWISVLSISGKFGISPTKEGPYLTLPVDRQDVLKTFGQPIRWAPYKPSRLSP